MHPFRQLAASRRRCNAPLWPRIYMRRSRYWLHRLCGPSNVTDIEAGEHATRHENGLAPQREKAQQQYGAPIPESWVALSRKAAATGLSRALLDNSSYVVLARHAVAHSIHLKTAVMAMIVRRPMLTARAPARVAVAPLRTRVISHFKVTFKTPKGEKTIDVEADKYLLDAAEVSGQLQMLYGYFITSSRHWCDAMRISARARDLMRHRHFRSCWVLRAS